MSKTNNSVEKGYPMEEPFASYDDMKEYFKTPKIVCLRCGKSYHLLGPHIRAKHGWDETKYREFYGLLYGQGLGSPKHIKNCAKNTKARYDRGEIPLKMQVKGEKRIMKPPRVFMFRKELQHKISPWSWADSPEKALIVFGEKLRQVHKVMLSKKVMIHEALSLTKIMSSQCFRKYINLNPDLKKEHEAVIAKLPMNVQNSSDYEEKYRKKYVKKNLNKSIGGSNEEV